MIFSEYFFCRYIQTSSLQLCRVHLDLKQCFFLHGNKKPWSLFCKIQAIFSHNQRRTFAAFCRFSAKRSSLICYKGHLYRTRFLSSPFCVLVPCQYRSQKLRVLSKNLVLSGVLTPCCAGLVLRVTLDFVVVGIYSSRSFCAERIVRKGFCVRIDLIDFLRHYLPATCSVLRIVLFGHDACPGVVLVLHKFGTRTPHTTDLVRAVNWSCT